MKYRLIPGSIFILNSNTSACARLIRRTFDPHELPTLIEAVLSGKDDGDTVRRLLRDDAQTFIDVIDEVRVHYPKSVS